VKSLDPQFNHCAAILLSARPFADWLLWTTHLPQNAMKRRQHQNPDAAPKASFEVKGEDGGSSNQ
jgi:hypothetical protein